VIQTKATLITFGISHFCEKARWALDWHGIPYTEIGWPPGLHRVLARYCGAKATTLPILLDGETVIQDSGAIIDWAETKAHDRTRSLTPEADPAAALEIERRANEVIGVHVRRLAFAEMLPSSSNRPCSTKPQVGTALLAASCGRSHGGL
jgi:glutathione S-transferase